jgi:Xaa-Pro aminopeptidase
VNAAKPQLLAALERHGIELLVCGFPPNVRYLTGYHNWMDPLSLGYMSRPGGDLDPQPVFAAITRAGVRGLTIQSVFLPNALSAGIDVIAPFGEFDSGPLPVHERLGTESNAVLDIAPTAGAALQRLIDALAGRPAEIAADSSFLSAGQRSLVATAARGAPVRDASATVLLARAVKSDDEVAMLRNAATAAEDAIHRALEGAGPGTTVSELRRRFRTGLADADADFDHLAFGAGGHGIAMEPDRPIGDDTILYVDFGCVLDGYFSDSGLTVLTDDPSDEATRAYDAVRAAIESGESKLRDGGLGSAVRAAMSDAVTEFGFPTSYPHGHGLGLQLRDYPILVDDTGLVITDDFVSEPADQALSAGNVVNLEAAIFDHRWGSVQIEKSYVIDRETGRGRPLLTQPRDEPVRLAD